MSEILAGGIRASLMTRHIDTTKSARLVAVTFLVAWPVFLAADLNWFSDLDAACRARVIRAVVTGMIGSNIGAGSIWLFEWWRRRR